jgi:hypothetical protein
MKTLGRTVIALLTTLTFFNTLALSDGISNPLIEHTLDITDAMVKMLASDKAPIEAKSKVTSILSGQEYEVRISVIKTEIDYSLGRSYITILIGEDDLNDDDEGWGVVYQLDIELQRNEVGDKYEVDTVNFKEIAG